MRDILHVDDAVAAYRAAWASIDRVAGRAFNLGGGPANAVSLRQLIGYLGDLIGSPIERRIAGWRPGDQRYYVSDTRCVIEALGLGPFTPWREGVTGLAGWLTEWLADGPDQGGTAPAPEQLAGAAE